MESFVAKQVCADLEARSERGFLKYGVTMDRTDLSLKDWLQHAYEESLDFCQYLKKAILELE